MLSREVPASCSVPSSSPLYIAQCLNRVIGILHVLSDISVFYSMQDNGFCGYSKFQNSPIAFCCWVQIKILEQFESIIEDWKIPPLSLFDPIILSTYIKVFLMLQFSVGLWDQQGKKRCSGSGEKYLTNTVPENFIFPFAPGIKI